MQIEKNPQKLKETCTIFSEWINRNLGIVYNKDNFFQLEIRVEKYMKEKKLERFDEFLTVLNGRCLDTKQQLIDLVVNNETYFFREEEFFYNLKDYLIKKYSQTPLGRTYKVWSMACSKGQEVYSLAFILEAVKEELVDFDYEILGSDISQTAINIAEIASYSSIEMNRGIDPNLIDKYFEINDRKYFIKPKYRNKTRFELFNLSDPWANIESCDLLLCRNVLYYLNDEERDFILKNSSNKILKDGHLILSGSENLISYPELFVKDDEIYASYKLIDRAYKGE